MEEKLKELLNRIGELDKAAMEQAKQRCDSLTKPLGSLGKPEEVMARIAGITGKPLPQVKRKAVVLMAGDHGVVKQGVSAYPQEVTPQMVSNFLAGGAAISVLAKHGGIQLAVADIGVAADLPPNPSLLSLKVAHGTNDFTQGPAMTRQQTISAILRGAEVAETLLADGVQILGTGEMGIGNTTPSAAITAVLTGHSVEDVTGRGTGIDDAVLHRKVDVIKKAIEVNHPTPDDALDVLAKLGGLEIAGLVGVILAGAAHRTPVVVDGFITGAAAAVAVSLKPSLRDFIIAGHCSEEPGHRILLEWMGLSPLLNLQMRLGEGTGAALAMHLVEAACNLLCEMATFGDAGVSGPSEE